MVLSWKDVGTTVGIDVAVSVAVFFVFNYLRRVSFLSDFYGAKRKLSIPFRFRPPRLPPTLFTWMVPVFTMQPDKFAACAGFDALSYVRVLSLCLRMSFWVMLTCFVFSLPANLTGKHVTNKLETQPANLNCSVTSGEAEDAASGAGTDEEDPRCKDAVTTFDKTSMTNIGTSEGDVLKLYSHVAALWIITYIVLSMLWHHYHESIKWRVAYLAATRKGDNSHSILVQDIPGHPQGTIIGRLYDNIDGTIGMLLPKKLKVKIQEAMTTGIGAVFGSVKDTVKLSSTHDIFRDKKYDVYLQPSDLEFTAQEQFADPERFIVGNSGSFFDATSQGGSFMSMSSSIGNSRRNTTGTPPLTPRVDNEPFNFTDDPLVDKAQANAQEATSSELRAVPNVAGRRNLRNFSSQRPATDFETWKQAETALQQGVTVQSLVAREFNRTLGPGSVKCVSVVKNQRQLAKLVTDYDTTKQKIEDLVDSWTSKLRRKQHVKRRRIKVKVDANDKEGIKQWGQPKSKQDEMEYLTWHLEDLHQRIKAEHVRVNKEDTSASFVTLSTRQMQSTTATGLLSFNEGLWKTSPAPSPGEVIWENISWRSWERSLRRALSWGCFIGLIIVFIPIVTFIQQLINLDVYAAKPGAQGAWARWLLGLPFLGEILKGIMPTLAFKIFLIVVPILLRLLATRLDGLASRSAVDFDVGKKYFLFQFIIVFLFNTIIGASSTSVESDSSDSSEESSSFPVLDLVEELANDPQKISTWLGTAIPQQAGFFIMYILTNGLLAKGIAFLRLPGAAIYLLLSRISGTKRQKKKCWSQQYVAYGDDVPDHTITILLLLVFSIAQPFVSFVAVLYFVANYFYARYDLLYTKREAFQSGGLFWPVIFDQIYISLVVALFGYFALFSIKGLAVGTALTVPLIITALCFYPSANANFKRPMTVLSLHAAADLDRADQKYDWMKDTTPEEEKEMKEHEWDLEGVKFGPVEERYVQPSLIFKIEQHIKVLGEANAMSKNVNAFNSGDRNHDDEPFMLDEESDYSDDGTHHYNQNPTFSLPMHITGDSPTP